MATLKDIGDAIGMSPATVSRALNGFPEVNAHTRARVLDMARKLKYKPNAIAQRLVSGRSNLIGVVLRAGGDMTTDATFYDMVAGLSEHLAANDMELIFQVASHDNALDAFERLVNKGIVDGFILSMPMPDDPRIRYLRGAGVPFVMHGRHSMEAVDYPYFDIDNHAACADAVSLLFDLGHRCIGLINGPDSLSFANERLRGYQDVHRLRGIQTHAELVFHGIANESHGYAAALSLLAREASQRPTAMVCANTLIAAGALHALSDRGLRCPEDVSIVAHDDAAPQWRAADFNPPLTVTRAPLRDACVPLAQAMIRQLEGVPATQLQTVVTAELVVRYSTATAPG